MNNRLLDHHELVVFHISHFCCEARRRDTTIDVQIRQGSAEMPFIGRSFSVDMTLREIKWRTAQALLSEVEVMLDTVHRYRDRHLLKV